MAKLTKAQAKAHQKACDLVLKDVLTEDEKYFVLENWQESATHINSSAGAFFTPFDLARDFAIETFPGRVIDLCAGIGVLSFAVRCKHQWDKAPLDLTCIEINPDYVAVGRKILPEAEWIEASVFDVLDMDLGHFDIAISNPPFGRVTRPESKRAPRYNGAEFEFHVIDIAAHLASYGAFILPQMSSGFRYSGSQEYRRDTSGKAVDFQNATGIYLGPNCGIDTATYKDAWRGVSPICEIVCCDFEQEQVQEIEATAAVQPATTSKPSAPAPNQQNIPQLDLFAEVAA